MSVWRSRKRLYRPYLCQPVCHQLFEDGLPLLRSITFAMDNLDASSAEFATGFDEIDQSASSLVGVQAVQVELRSDGPVGLF